MERAGKVTGGAGGAALSRRAGLFAQCRSAATGWRTEIDNSRRTAIFKPSRRVTRQVGSCLGYTGRVANVVATVALDPLQTLHQLQSCRGQSHNSFCTSSMNL